MVREFSLVVFDIENKIIDRFNLNLASDPSGLGFKLKLSLIESDIENILTKVVEEKKSIKLRINNTEGYNAGNILTNWIQKYTKTNSRMGLGYNDTKRQRYCEGRVVELTRTELNEYSVLAQDLIFMPLTPFFTNIENQIYVEMSSTGKNHPYKYPYSYGKSKIENNLISNPYILDVPVTIRINGGITTPMIQLLDADGIAYNTVSFNTVTLSDTEHIIINSAERKIWFWGGAAYSDITQEVNPMYDTFLRAKAGESTLSDNLLATDTGNIIGSWRQYGLC